MKPLLNYWNGITTNFSKVVWSDFLRIAMQDMHERVANCVFTAVLQVPLNDPIQLNSKFKPAAADTSNTVVAPPRQEEHCTPIPTALLLLLTHQGRSTAHQLNWIQYSYSTLYWYYSTLALRREGGPCGVLQGTEHKAILAWRMWGSKAIFNFVSLALGW